MKNFNVEGLCVPSLHYMVDTSAKVEQIVRDFVEPGKYFVINRARQFGKTTTLMLLERRLRTDYTIIPLSFEGKEELFVSQANFAYGVCSLFYSVFSSISQDLAEVFHAVIDERLPFIDLRRRITLICLKTKQPIIVMIDEVDRASDYAVFRSFLGMLRDLYLASKTSNGEATFHSVILAGVHDIKNLKAKIRPDADHTYNSPWNIAANFDIDMSFSPPDIETMLEDYEEDYHTGMDVNSMASHIHYYTDGYPFLVSRICKEIHDKSLEWSTTGIDAATKRIIKENNTLFDDIIKNLQAYPDFSKLIEGLLLHGDYVGFNHQNPVIQMGFMHGVIKDNDGNVVIANRIFATMILNYYTSINETNKALARLSVNDISLFVKNGTLDFDTIMNRFNAHMKSIYHDRDSVFYEREGRVLFTTYLSPIINGTGYWIPEAETRGGRRMDLTIVYGKNIYIVELKIWRGEKYETEGYDQLAQYCKAKGQRVGYMISFCDLKQKQVKGGVLSYNGVEIHEEIVAFRDETRL